VTVAIQLDDQVHCRAVEIGNEWSKGMLPSELKAIRALAQLLPKEALRRTRGASELTRPLHSLISLDLPHGLAFYLSTALHAVPLPVCKPGRKSVPQPAK
jgi:hypothetical protein